MTNELKVVSISLPVALVREIDKLCDLEHRNRSDLYREAIRVYLKTRKWNQLRDYASAKASASGMTRVDIESLIDEFSEA